MEIDLYMWNILLCDSVIDIICSFDLDFFFSMKFYEVCCIYVDFYNRNKKDIKKIMFLFWFYRECNKEIKFERSDYYLGCIFIVV